jgi:hypothetical protein
VDVDVGQELFKYEGVVRVGVIPRQSNVFIHVKGYHVLKGNLDESLLGNYWLHPGNGMMFAYFAGLVLANEKLIDTKRTGSRGEAKDEWVLWSGLECLDATNHIVGNIHACSMLIVPDDQTHDGKRWGCRYE